MSGRRGGVGRLDRRRRRAPVGVMEPQGPTDTSASWAPAGGELAGRGVMSRGNRREGWVSATSLLPRRRGCTGDEEVGRDGRIRSRRATPRRLHLHLPLPLPHPPSPSPRPSSPSSSRDPSRRTPPRPPPARGTAAGGAASRPPAPAAAQLAAAVTQLAAAAAPRVRDPRVASRSCRLPRERRRRRRRRRRRSGRAAR